MPGEELITSSVLVKIISADKIRLTSPPNPEKRGHAAAGPKRKGKPNYGAGPKKKEPAQILGKQDKFGGAAVSHVFC